MIEVLNHIGIGFFIAGIISFALWVINPFDGIQLIKIDNINILFAVSMILFIIGNILMSFKEIESNDE